MASGKEEGLLSGHCKQLYTSVTCSVVTVSMQSPLDPSDVIACSSFHDLRGYLCMV